MIRRLFSLALLALLAAGLLAGCSRGGGRTGVPRVLRTAEDSLAFWRWRADSIDAALGSLEQVRGVLPQGAGNALFTAWFDSGQVRVIHETLDLDRMGSRSNRYFFERGVPRLALESGRVPFDTTLALHRLDRAMLFDDYGRVVAATKTVDSTKTWVAGYEASAAVGHAQQLRTAAQAQRQSEGSGAPAGGGAPGKK